MAYGEFYVERQGWARWPKVLVMRRVTGRGPDEQRRYVPESRVKVLEDEVAKLQEELAKWERLAAGIDLPEYPVTQFQPKDLERENAKLRELVRDMWALQIALPYGAHIEIRDRMRELGIEVNDG